MVNKCPAVGAGGGRMGAIEFDLCIGDIERSNAQVAKGARCGERKCELTRTFEIETLLPVI